MTWTYTLNDLHYYQKYAIIKAIKKRHCILSLGTGLGKTIIALTVIDQLLKRNEISKALIVCTKKAMYNTWRQEAKTWKHTQHLKFAIIHGDAHKGNSNYVKRRQLFSDVDIHLINYEGLPWLSDVLSRSFHNRLIPWQCIVYDESTKMKHSTNQRFLTFKKFMGKFVYRYPMTGTLIPNGYLDLFGQVYIMDLGMSLGTSLDRYRRRYFFAVPSSGGYFNYKPIKGTKKALTKRLKDRVIHMPKEEYVKLPPITYNKIMLDLPDELRKQYDELEYKFFLELKEAKVEAFSAGTLSMKLRQFLQGKVYVYEKNIRKVVKIHTEKLEMVSEMMEGIGNCIIAYNFQFERDDLQSVFKKAPAIDGRTTDKQASQYIQAWNNKQVSVLLFNPASDPHGLNLQKGGHNVLWYSLTWNLEHYIQLIDRLWRQGQEKKVFVHHVLFRDTVDEIVYNTLQVKDKTQTSLLSRLKEYGQKKGVLK